MPSAVLTVIAGRPLTAISAAAQQRCGRADETEVHEARLWREAQQREERVGAKVGPHGVEHRRALAPYERHEERYDDQPAQARERDGRQHIEQAARGDGATG